MIRMTKQADYAIFLLTHMASEPIRVFPAAELAEAVHLPGPTVSKILKMLARSEVLESHRGVKGGYSLARQPGSINVAEIITALEGPIAITECINDGPGECSVEPICTVRGHWQRINQGIRGALEAITLAEMASPPPADRLVNLGGGAQREAGAAR